MKNDVTLDLFPAFLILQEGSCTLAIETGERIVFIHSDKLTGERAVFGLVEVIGG